MFGNKKSNSSSNSIDSLIGVSTRVEGNITFSGGLRIDGEVKGNISSENPQEGMLVISERACVEGSISVGHVVVNGTVIGPVFAGKSLELQPSARVTGDMEYSQIEILQGAVVQGRLVHQAHSKTVELKLASGN